MAFREPTFTEGLDQLNKGNFLGGLVLAAQGDLIKEQTLSTQNVIATFSKRLQELESTPLSTDEQMARLNQDPDVKNNTNSLQNMIGDYQSLTYSIFERQKMVNSIYGDTMNALAGIGGEQAGNISKSLAGQYGMKTEELQQLGKMPLQSAEYQKTLLDIENTKFNLEEGRFKLQELRDSKEGLTLFYDMLNDAQEGLFNRNRITGIRRADVDLFKQQMAIKHGDSPFFARGMYAFENFLREKTQDYYPEVRGGLDGSKFGSGAYLDNLAQAKGLYNDLSDVAFKVGTITADKEQYGWVQDEYQKAAVGKYGEPDPQKPNELWRYKFGADKSVIEEMTKGEKEAGYVFEQMYDKTNRNNYWNNLSILGKFIGRTPDAYEGNVGGFPDPYNPTGKATFDMRRLITNAPGRQKVKPYSTRKGISEQEEYLGGWYNPYGDATLLESPGKKLGSGQEQYMKETIIAPR